MAIVVVGYAAALRGGFIWDDDSHVTANPVIIGPLGLREIWTTAAANYLPLVLTSFWLQHALWGLDPFGYHAVTLLGLGVLTWRQTAAFANNEILWRTTLARHPDTPMAWLNLGATLAEQHREAEAIACFRRVAERRPADADAQSDAGWGLLKAGYPEPAVQLLERAVHLNPNHREAHNTLGNALRKLGRLAERATAQSGASPQNKGRDFRAETLELPTSLGAGQVSEESLGPLVRGAASRRR